MKILKSNQFWGSRSGAYSADVPKGSDKPWGNVFKQQQWSSGRERRGSPKKCSLHNTNHKWFV